MIAAGVLLAVSFMGAKRLKLDTDLTKLLPRTFESVRNLDVLAERSFGLGYVTVVATGAEPDQLRAFARDFGPKLEALELIQYVDYERPVKWFRDRALFYVYRVTARDYGSPTTRERCIVTTFPLEHETNLNRG